MVRTVRSLVLAIVVLASSLLAANVASAHDDSHRDGNDSKANFDIARVQTSHHKDRVRFQVSLYETYHGKDIDVRLGRYFMIGLDVDMKSGDRKIFERCIFVVDRPAPKAIGTDCAGRRYDDWSVGRPTTKSFATTIDLKRLQVDGSYRFAVISYWGAKSCPNDLCVDAAPNRLPLYLEDREKPTIGLTVPPQTEASFPIEFTIKDPKGSGIQTWVLEKSRVGSDVWETVASGKGDGLKSPIVTPGGGAWSFRVRATDKHENTGVSAIRNLTLPYDDLEFTDFGAFTGTTSDTSDAAAFGGSYTSMASNATYVMSFTATGCSTIRLSGPGVDGWTVGFTLDSDPTSIVAGTDVPDGARQQLATFYNVCPGPHTIKIEVTSGSGFGVDSLSVQGGTIAP